jgi:hypothetical protein
MEDAALCRRRARHLWERASRAWRKDEVNMMLASLGEEAPNPLRAFELLLIVDGCDLRTLSNSVNAINALAPDCQGAPDTGAMMPVM